MIQGVISTGFAFEVDEKQLDNMELVDAIAEVEENPVAVSRVIRMLLGDHQRKALYDSLRTEDGRVPVAALTQALVEIFTSVGNPAKN